MTFKKFKIKGKFLSLHGHYTIYDAEDNIIYTVTGKAFSRKFSMLNQDGEEVLKIKRKLFALRFTYFIFHDDIPVFKIVKSLGFKPTIFVESLTDPDAFLVQGNIWDSEYAFYQGDSEFAYVSKKMWSIGGVYGIAIAEGWNEELALAMVVIIDVIRRTKNRRK